MTGITLLLITLTFFMAFALSYFWYKGKNKSGSLFWTLFLLRGLALWILAVMLINPQFQKYSYYTEKPQLNVLVDNSESMAHIGGTAAISNAISELQTNSALNENFEIRLFTFEEDLQIMDSMPDFKGRQTDIATVFTRLKKLGGELRNATLLFTDGNSTYGSDYQYNPSGWNGPVYTIAAGDTARYKDLRVERVNANRYAYANNRFPVEVFVALSGNETVNTVLEIREGERLVYRESMKVEAGRPSVNKQLELEAGAPGLKRYRIFLKTADGEKNTANNQYDFAVEVIGQRDQIAIVTNTSHPDLGVLVNMIEKQGQRKVELLEPSQLAEADNFDMVILFSPNQAYTDWLQYLKRSKKNYMIIAGEGTNWSTVNNEVDAFSREATYSKEAVQGIYNPGFDEFRSEDPGISQAPPINSLLGDFILNTAYDVLIFKQINGFDTQRPLLFTVDMSGQRMAVLDGSGIWKWRLWHYAEQESFDKFDAFWNTLVRYLLTGIQRDRLNVVYESFYPANSPVSIRAGYYDKNFVFDPSEQLEITIKKADTAETRTIPLMQEDQGYRVNLDGLSPGNYEFTLSAPSQGLSTDGQFTVLEYNLEKQFVTTDTQRMRSLAERTGGQFLMIDSLPNLIVKLARNENLKPLQKRKQEQGGLVDWPWLLLAVCLLFGAEWFVRKYNGLI